MDSLPLQAKQACKLTESANQAARNSNKSHHNQPYLLASAIAPHSLGAQKVEQLQAD
jgi:hypothetical protein